MADVLSAVKLPKQLSDILKKIPKLHWVGNYAPNPHHFTNVTLDGGLKGDRIWVTAHFTDAGIDHILESRCAAKTFGQRKGDDQIWLDSVLMDAADEITGVRTGLFGVHIVVEFKFVKDGQHFDARFDSQ